MMIRHKAYARGGLIGNPSDGYYGKTIALCFTNFRADVVLYETPELEILPNIRDHSRFKGISELANDVRLFGYYGGIRLLKATVKRFHDYATAAGHSLHTRNFTLHYTSNIPHLVGLAGSSAIITACMRCMLEYYGVDIPKPELANLILSVERDELNIAAGLQDRVAQVYEGLVYMDFDRKLMSRKGYGQYEYLDHTALPPLYIAYRKDLSQVSEIVHHNLRERFTRGDAEVIEAIEYWAGLTDQVKQLINEQRGDEIGPLLNANFDRRAELYDVGNENRKMVDAARSIGASAKFTGSGGAIIGTYEDSAMLDNLKTRLNDLGCEVIIPETAEPQEETNDT